jgi:hypothetical protein
MSRPGFAYDGYRWEHGWPAERTGALTTEQTMDEVTTDGTASDTRMASVTNNHTTESNMDNVQVVSIPEHTPIYQLLLEFSEGAGSLEQPEPRTPLLPSSLDPTACFEVFHFSTSSTCPAVIFGFDRKATHELLLSLSTSLRRGFSFAANPEAILVRDPPAQPEGDKESTKVLTIILAGASILVSSSPFSKLTEQSSLI